MTRRIAIASTIWGLSILLSRLVGLVREAVIGRTIGAGAEADVYWTAFVLPDFLNYLLAGGALSIVFIPIYGAWIARGDERRANEAFGAVATFLAVLLVVLTTALWLAVPVLAPLVAPGFDARQLEELVSLSRIVLPAQVFHVLGGLLSAALQARDRHAVPALAPLVYTLGVIAGGLIGETIGGTGGDTGAGAHGFAWGVLAGSALGPFALPLVAASRAGLVWRWRWSPRDPDLLRYLARSLPIMLGFSIVVADDWYLRREASLLGAGAVSALTYAKTLMKVPIGVFGLAAGVAAYPTLARLVAENKVAEMHATLSRALRHVLVLAFAAQAALTVAGAEIVALVYGRRLLTSAEIESIATALAWVSVGLGAWAAQPLLARGFYALGNTWLPALLGTAVALVAYPLYVLARRDHGIEGLAIASSCAIVVYVVALALCLRREIARRTGTAASPGALAFLARAAIALGASTLAVRALARAWPVDGTTADLVLRSAVLGGASIALFLALARLLGVREATSALEPLARRFTALTARTYPRK